MNHPCELMYQFSNAKIYGKIPGICRITGKESVGILFDKWVKDTFTDHAYLKPGTIISNEALFCFEEQSKLLMQMTGRNKPQRFRTYSHIVVEQEWHLLSKAQKPEIYDLLTNTDPLIAVIADSGQKHLLFKHRIGTWMFENETIMRDKINLRLLKETVESLLAVKFSKDEIQTGKYQQWKILECGLPFWQAQENKFKRWRGSALFDLAVWLARPPEMITNKTKEVNNGDKNNSDRGGKQTAFAFVDGA